MKWKKADPIPRLEKVLLARGATEAQLQALREKAKAVNDEALAFAIASESPKPATVGDFVYA